MAKISCANLNKSERKDILAFVLVLGGKIIYYFTIKCDVTYRFLGFFFFSVLCWGDYPLFLIC